MVNWISFPTFYIRFKILYWFAFVFPLPYLWTAFWSVPLGELLWPLVVSQQQPCWQSAENTFTLGACSLQACPSFSGYDLLLPSLVVLLPFLSLRYWVIIYSSDSVTFFCVHLKTIWVDIFWLVTPVYSCLQLYFGLMIFVGYMVVDTQEMIERAHLGDLDYVKHALTLFTDFIAVFVRILIIMVSNKVPLLLSFSV